MVAAIDRADLPPGGGPSVGLGGMPTSPRGGRRHTPHPASRELPSWPITRPALAPSNVAMDMLQTGNLALRLVLELGVLVALGYWGFLGRSGRSRAMRIGLGLGGPLVAALVWITLGAPGAPLELSDPLHLLLELVFFGSAALSLGRAGRPGPACWLAALAAANRGLMYVWGQ